MSARIVAAFVALVFVFSAGSALAGPKYAKTALYYDGLTRVVEKGVSRVTNPSTGIWCIKRSWKGRAYNHIGIATAEVDTSGGVDLLVHWAYGAGNCKNQKGWFEVRTYRLNGGNWVLANDVAFSFMVP